MVSNLSARSTGADNDKASDSFAADLMSLSTWSRRLGCMLAMLGLSEKQNRPGLQPNPHISIVATITLLQLKLVDSMLRATRIDFDCLTAFSKVCVSYVHERYIT